MADEPTTPTPGQAPETPLNPAAPQPAPKAPATTQAKADDTKASDKPDDGDSSEPKTSDPKEASRAGYELRQAREKLEAATKELEGYKAKEEEARLAQLSETERLTEHATTATRERDEARTELRQLQFQIAVGEAIADSGAIKPGKLLRLVDQSSIKVSEETGKPDSRSLSAAIEKLKADYPEEFGQRVLAGDAGAGRLNGSAAEVDMNRLIRSRL